MVDSQEKTAMEIHATKEEPAIQAPKASKIEDFTTDSEAMTTRTSSTEVVADQTSPLSATPSNVGDPAGQAAMSAIAATTVVAHGDGDGEDEEHSDYLHGFRLACAMLALCMATFLVMLDSSILSTATPTITNEFHSVQDLGWYVSAYQLALASLQPLTGKFFTYFKNKWTYLIFISVFEIGSLVCGLATSSPMLIGGRAVAGLGASGIFNGGLTIISGLVPLRQRPAMTGIIMGLSQLGLIGGPLIGGSLTEFTTWRWCFYINLPIGGLACFILVIVHIPEQIAKPTFKSVVSDGHILRKFDIVGSLILVPAIVQLLLALQWGGNKFAWDSATIIGMFCGFGGTLAVFVLWEYRAGVDAMIPLFLFRNLIVVASCVSIVCLFGVSLIASYFIPIYFQSILGDSPFESGVHLLPSILSQLIMAVLSGILVSKLGYYLPWAVFAGAVTSIGAGLISTFTPYTSTATWIGYQIVFGVGRGPAMQVGMIAVQTVLPKSQVAVALTIMVFMQSLGGAVLTTIANTIFDTSLVSEIHKQVPGVDAEAVLAAGATAFREVVSPEDLPGVLQAFANSFRNTAYLAVGLSCAMFVASWGLGWYDVRKTNPDAEGDKKKEKEAVAVPGDGSEKV